MSPYLSGLVRKRTGRSLNPAIDPENRAFRSLRYFLTAPKSSANYILPRLGIWRTPAAAFPPSAKLRADRQECGEAFENVARFACLQLSEKGRADEN
jgi:hypothetical protein